MSNKKFWQSKKFMAYLLLMAVSAGVILSCIFTRQPSDVVREAISAFGMAITAGSAVVIGGQSIIDRELARRDD